MGSSSHVMRVRNAVSVAQALKSPIATNQQSEQVPSVNWERVIRSWSRCVNDFNLDPERWSPPDSLNAAEIKRRCSEKSSLLTQVRPEMEKLYQQFADHNSIVVIADATGLVLETLGNGNFLNEAARLGIRPGADWSECSTGTNGVGTCIAEGRIITIHRNEHFFPSYTKLSCSGAPIFDANGKLSCVLELTSEADMDPAHIRSLIGMSAQTIENNIFSISFDQHWLLHFHSRRELLPTFMQGIIAIDEQGVIKATNRSVHFQLNVHSSGNFIGRNIEEFFNIIFSEFKAQLKTEQTVSLQDLRGRFFFFFLTPPRAQNNHLRSVTGRQASTASPRTEQSRQPTLTLAQPQKTDKSYPEDQQKDKSSSWGDALIDSQFLAARKVYEGDVPILLCGETGTGKELFAQALHDASSRAHGPFIAVNCAAMPETLIESELFGYRGGAFTGASREGRRGRILAANKGTLLLDEIGDMPLPLQARLLRVLESREVAPLGCEQPIKVDIRIICATHCNLATMISAGQFRSDLYFRLAGFNVQLPPLRKRSNRKELICSIAKNICGTRVLSNEAFDLLERYSWPGNLRQLRNVLQTVHALCVGNTIGIKDFPDMILNPNIESASASPAALAECEERSTQPEHPANSNDNLTYLDQAERDALLRLLRQHRWNVTHVASSLGASRNTVYRKINQFGLSRARS